MLYNVFGEEARVPPRTRFTPERILDAALALTRSAGIDMVTARSLATWMGSSTAPMFTHFSSMDDVHEQLMDRIIERFVETAARPVHSDPLVAAGIGWLTFASDEPRLYEAVFLRHHPWHYKWGPIRRQLAQRMVASPQYAGLDKTQCFALVSRASIVIHGLGLEIWSGRLPPHDLQTLVEQLAIPPVRQALAQGWGADLHAATLASSDTIETGTTL